MSSSTLLSDYPRDKGQVVQLMGRELNVRTLAIGDGANDVSMIRCANVGCGIAGAEDVRQVFLTFLKKK